MLPFPQSPDDVFVTRIGQQMKAANAFDRDDFPVTNRVDGGFQRRILVAED